MQHLWCLLVSCETNCSALHSGQCESQEELHGFRRTFFLNFLAPLPPLCSLQTDAVATFFRKFCCCFRLFFDLEAIPAGLEEVGSIRLGTFGRSNALLTMWSPGQAHGSLSFPIVQSCSPRSPQSIRPWGVQSGVRLGRPTAPTYWRGAHEYAKPWAKTSFGPALIHNGHNEERRRLPAEWKLHWVLMDKAGEKKWWVIFIWPADDTVAALGRIAGMKPVINWINWNTGTGRHEMSSCSSFKPRVKLSLRSSLIRLVLFDRCRIRNLHYR